jgi:hypothetical protein
MYESQIRILLFEWRNAEFISELPQVAKILVFSRHILSALHCSIDSQRGPECPAWYALDDGSGPETSII